MNASTVFPGTSDGILNLSTTLPYTSKLNEPSAICVALILSCSMTVIVIISRYEFGSFWISPMNVKVRNTSSVGAIVGKSVYLVRSRVGKRVDCSDGSSVGTKLTSKDGRSVGLSEDMRVGYIVGVSVFHHCVGYSVGSGYFPVGTSDGVKLGFSVG